MELVEQDVLGRGVEGTHGSAEGDVYRALAEAGRCLQEDPLISGVKRLGYLLESLLLVFAERWEWEVV